MSECVLLQAVKPAAEVKGDDRNIYYYRFLIHVYNHASKSLFIVELGFWLLFIVCPLVRHMFI